MQPQAKQELTVEQRLDLLFANEGKIHETQMLDPSYAFTSLTVGQNMGMIDALGFVAARLDKDTAMQIAGILYDARAIPSVLNDDLKFILGRPTFWCGPYSIGLRALGHEIANKAEHEQAAVIHWLLQHYLTDPINWREAVEADLNKAKEAVAAGKAKPMQEGEEQQ